ncbi:hypothetical protein SAMN05660236_1835 [Ohtaekwangia koreensis]|uniref:Fibronectin type-III domain-containing protein n=2 Tax=Ohtaekwangia koreensis TaxID=688867 RepID=A0A1T5K5T6_9BACT|nr:hypothetical protein SAMN05660236_1835 [Ohtaekwangia koreensis]
MLKRYWFYIVLLSALVLQAQAQTTYPIQVNANLLPPYSAYLSDYYSGTREKLTLTLINRDQFKPTLNVRLRMIITAPGGLRLQTNEQSFIEPIIVENGSPVRLTQDDLAPYFQPQNLITQGYMTSGKFPEGMVEFCFQAVEAYTGQALSLSTCTRAWITSQKPPLLSLPRNNESIVFREPLNVLFQWTPLHQGLAQVEYEFILKELWDNGMTPQAAFPYAPEIYRETTRSTSLVYGAMQPPLLAGKRYAWCIRAQARDGMDAVNLFQNDGYSEIRWFTLQDNCAPPEFVMATAEKKRLNVEWTALPDHIGFSVSYRVIKARTSDGKVDASEWKEQQSQEPKVILYGLQSGGTYEYRVGSYCMAGQPVYSPIFTITLPETDSARLAQCGIMPNVNLTNKEPIKELKTGEIIMANDYPVTVTKISGVNGIYTGEGWTIVPWLNDAKIAVQFTSITVNTDKQMINGYIDAKYDKNEGQIANLDDVFEGGFDVGTVKTGITKIDHVLDFSIPGVEAFSLNEEGDLVITDSEGEPHTITPASNEGQGNEGNKVVVFPMTVQDKDGNVYQVEKVTETDATGKEVEKAKATYIGRAGTPLAEGSFDPSQLNGDKAIVTFAKGDGIYGFDTWLDYYDNVSLIENKYQKLYTGYYAPWKLVPVGKTDKVVATIEIKDKNIKPEQVIFKTPKGTEYKATYENGKYTLQLAAGPAGDVQELYALYPNGKDKYYTLGKLNIVSYELQKYTVVLVPVNNVPVDKQAIQKTLQDIYGAVGVTWDVILDANFDYTDNYRLMEKSTGLSTYNEDMRALNNAYKSARPENFDKAANYLFFLKATGSEDINDRDATGFMPRGSQFGYIFTSEIKDINEPITVAHELGHGRWKLFHTFDEHYGGYKKGETENVMDYNNGHHVAKWQWDIMHDPAMLVSIFEGDEKSNLAVVNNLTQFDKFKNSDGSYTFLSPGGVPITLPATTTMVAFATGENWISGKFKVAPFGSLVFFTYRDTTYSAKGRVDDGKFLYYESNKGTFFKDKLTSIVKPDKAIVGYPCLDANNKTVFVIYQQGISTTLPAANTVYLAAGPLQEFDSFINYFMEGGQAPVSIAVEARHNLSEEAKEYLSFRSEYAGCKSSIAPYIFVHAYQITYNPGTYNYCNRYTDYRSLDPMSVYLDNLPLHKGYQENQIAIPQTDAMKYYEEVRKWSTGIDIYKKRQTALEKLKTLKTIDKVDDLVSICSEFKGYECVWEGIDYENRIHALKKLLEGVVADYWLSWGNDKENLFNQMLKTTPIDDRVKLLNEFTVNGNELLFKAYSKLDLSSNDKFIGILTSWVLSVKSFEVAEVGMLMSTPVMYGQPIYPAKMFNWRHESSGVSGKRLSKMDNRLYWYSMEQSGYVEINPFDIVKIIFETNFPGDIKEGKTLVVPAIWAYRFQANMGTQSMLTTIRVLLDAAVIVSTLGTGSGAVAAIEVGFATTDIFLMGVKADVVKEFDGAEGFYEAWDTAYGIASLYTAGVGLRNLAVSGKLKMSFNFGELLSNVKTFPAQAKSSLSGSFKTMAAFLKRWGAVKNIANWETLYFKLMDMSLTLDLQAIRVSATNAASTMVMEIKDLTRVIMFNAAFNYEIARYAIKNNQVYLSQVRWLPLAYQGEIQVLERLKPASYEGRFFQVVENAELEIVSTSTGIFVREFGTAASGLNFADDVAEFGKRVITLGSGDVTKVKGWLNHVNDGSLYVAVHGDGTLFKVIHNGVEVDITHRSLARWILDQNLTTRNIVLLSCSDISTAQNLSNKLGAAYNVTAWEGAVEVFETGYIAGGGKCYSFTANKNPVQLTGSGIPKGKTGSFMTEESVVLSGKAGTMLDGLQITQQELKSFQKFQRAGHTNLIEADFIKAYRRLNNISGSDIGPILQKATVNHDIVRLEKLIHRTGNNMTKVNTLFAENALADYAFFSKVIDYLDVFSTQSIQGVKPNYFSNATKVFDDVNMDYILRKHTAEHFDFSGIGVAQDIDFFPIGTTEQQVAGYIDEALSILRTTKGPNYPINGAYEQVTLKNGMKVEIGSNPGNLIVNQPKPPKSPFTAEQNVIGHFYPVEGGIRIKSGQLKVIKKIIL